MRIVFLGDSLTWGGYGGDFVDVIAKKLPEHEIINAGVGGDTVVNLLRRLDDVLAQHQPDAMFVMVGGNDANSYTFPAIRGYYKKAKQLDGGMVTPDEFEETYRELLNQLQLNFVQVVVGLSPSEYSREVVEAKKDYNKLARSVAENFNIPILDLDAIYTPKNPIEREAITLGFIQQIGANWDSGWDKFEEERDKWGYTYSFDGLHIMPEMGEEFAKHIVSFLQEELL